MILGASTTEVAIVPSKESFSNEDINNISFRITISDAIPPQAILGKINVPPLDMGDSVLLNAEGINDRIWILMDSKKHFPFAPQTPIQSLVASTPLKQRDIKCEALGLPADVAKYREVFKNILSSLKIKQ